MGHTVGRVAELAFAVSSLALLGLSWTVLVVVYPGFAEVGAASEPGVWSAAHAAHSRRMSLAVAPLWAVEGVAAAVLLATRPGGVPLWLVLLGDAGAALTVATTIAGALPAHAALAAGWDAGAAVRLQRWHAWRTLGWLVAAACGTAGLLLA